MAKKFEKFEDLEVWKESMQLTVYVYHYFKSLSYFGFRDQVQISAVSIPFIAKSSAAELRTQLYLANEIQYAEKTKGLE